MVEFYFSNGHSILLTQRTYQNYFNTRNAPSQTAINRLIARFRQQGGVSDLPRSGRPRIVQNQVNIDRVRDSVEEYPETSTRRRSGQLGISRTSLRRILSRHLHMHPYKVQLAQQLLPLDYRQRLIWATRPNRIISRNSEFNWPTRSPDLTAPDYFLWGYLKERVYVNKPQTIEQLKHNIEAEIRAIEPETLRAVMQNACLRAQLCIDENGGHLSDIIFQN